MAPPHKYDRRPAGAAGGFEDGERDEKFTLSAFEQSENESKGVPLAGPSLRGEGWLAPLRSHILLNNIKRWGTVQCDRIPAGSWVVRTDYATMARSWI